MSLQLRLAWKVDLDASELVRGMLSTIERECREALRTGVRPDTGAARPSRGGNTWGVSSGRLLGSIHSSPVVGDHEFAEGRVSVSADRQEFADLHGVLTTEGRVGKALDVTISDRLGH